MLSKLPKYFVGLAVAGSIAYLAVDWFLSRGYDRNAMAGIPEYDNVDESSILSAQDINAKLEPSYLAYAAERSAQGVSDAENVELVLPAAAFSSKSPSGAAVESGIGDLPGTSLVLSEENAWVEYEIDVPRDGFYQIGMTYYAMPGKRASVLRSLQIDGAYPFYQAKKLEFTRLWTEEGDTWFDNQGNEYNAKQKETFGWQYREFRDAEAKVSEPFRFHLTQGKHTLRLHMIREPAAIGEIRVFAPVRLPSYEEVAKSYETNGYKPTTGHLIKIQAESPTLKSDPTLRRIENREPLTEPFNKKGVGLNTFGDLAWKRGGQWAEWAFEAPESGLYEVGARFGSWWLNGIPVERIVSIDGAIPFREMNAVKFPYEENWQVGDFGLRDEPYLFYLEKGEHRIRMEVQVGSLGEAFEKVRDVSRKMSLLSREIILYTGTNPDPNRDWELERKIPNLIPRLHLMARGLDDAMKMTFELGVDPSSAEVGQLGVIRDQLLDMAEDPNTIPGRMQAMTDSQSSLGLWITNLSQQSLDLDYLIVKSPDTPWPPAEAHWAKKAWYSFQDFLLSFRKDYSGIGNVYEAGEGERTLDVWVARGRDWVEIIKQLADEDFTPQTGIKVNVNVIPAQAMNLLMLSTTSGKQPDAALGVEAEVPIDFAIRGAVVDLSEFPDYEDIASRFRPGALIPYAYDGGAYALPENQNFTMLFYRTDIMNELGVEDIPETWDEVMDLIPILQQNGMDFYYPHASNAPQLAVNEFSPFLFQYGGEYYKEGGSRSALDTPEAMEAVKVWTGLFTNYKINKDANFYNRFRSGEMPIGVADYSTYVLLSTAAPELSGWWEMKPMPGVRQEDGRINRSTGGSAQTGMIFKNTGMEAEAWEFLKWWTSADVQERFGGELESILGVEARWNTANVEALERLPWPAVDIEAILEQWEWFREREVVLGGYYTTRHVANIWNEIVLNGKNRREAVEDGIREIDRELRKKREEFGLGEPGSSAE
ncbi:extracellular solute-binding protein [Paenibacillus antri]|uniref:Extracellular solute-binding protein n=1 Tax=Paenibacillus antri TaxID=2582848 RepID=A0A5R9G865_9BACL|nr:extracellular solute-binding protein [Paenibacillus antri]TLS52607.1 extracellular solute-binding protein [Paenibacillus antri]